MLKYIYIYIYIFILLEKQEQREQEKKKSTAPFSLHYFEKQLFYQKNVIFYNKVIEKLIKIIISLYSREKQLFYQKNMIFYNKVIEKLIKIIISLHSKVKIVLKFKRRLRRGHILTIHLLYFTLNVPSNHSQLIKVFSAKKKKK